MYRPRQEADRLENFAAARVHFQSVLDAFEAQLRRTPYLWFNYTAMNPPCVGPEHKPAGGRALQPLGRMRPTV